MDQEQQQQAKTKNRAPSIQEDSFKQGGAGREANSTNNPPPPESSPMPPQIDSPVAPPSPPSTASPTHEFSFTVSIDNMNRVPLHPPPPSTAAAALDLSPADDIFFHGHLLPLHFLSHLPVSPRSSTNSLESFTLPIKDSQREHHLHNIKSSKSESINISSTNRSNIAVKERPKSKSFSLFGLPKWRKGCEVGDRGGEKEKQGRKQRFDVSRVLKRYVTMMRPLLLFARRRKDALRVRRQTYSFSGILSPRDRERQGRRGLFSAPASMRASPTNSGLILAKATSNPPCTATDSTMEELQAAIQAAIAHCKNSIAAEDKLQV